MESILNFIKSNKGLTVGAMLSFIVFASYEITMDWPEIMPYGDFIFNLVSQLSLAYMGSFIFYIVQVYIPEARKNKAIKESIRDGLDKILVELIDPIKYTNRYFLKEDVQNDIFSDEKIDKISKHIELFSRSGKINGRGETVSVLEYMYINNMKIKQEVACIYKTLGIHLDIKLVNILNEIDNVDEYNFIQRTKEYYILWENKKLNNNYSMNLNDMYINPSKYDSYSTKGLYEGSISHMFKKQYRLYRELESYYLNM